MSFKTLSNQYQGTTIYNPENHPDIEVDAPDTDNLTDNNSENENENENNDLGDTDNNLVDNENDNLDDNDNDSDNDSSNLNEDPAISDNNDENLDDLDDLDDLAERSEINRRILDNRLPDEEEFDGLFHTKPMFHELVSNESNASESYQTLTQSEDDDSNEEQSSIKTSRIARKSQNNDARKSTTGVLRQSKVQTLGAKAPTQNSSVQHQSITAPTQSKKVPTQSTREQYLTKVVQKPNTVLKPTSDQIFHSSYKELRTSVGLASGDTNVGKRNTSTHSPANSNIDLKVAKKSVVPEPIVHKKVVQTTGHLDRIRVLTYNLWFDEESRLERAQQIIHLIKKQQLEIIGLQEVTPETYELLIKFLKSDYLIYQIFIDEKLPYGDCLLLRREKITIVEPYFYDFPKTAMSRKILGCEIQILGFQKTLHILNTHLESGRNNHELRAHQIQIIREIISKHEIKNVIVLGDFNITSLKEEAEDLLQRSGLRDAWIEIGCPTELKYTFDFKRNPRVQGNFRARLDRILYQLELSHLLTGLKLVGVTRDLPPPSDHFGLQAEFIFKRNF